MSSAVTNAGWTLADSWTITRRDIIHWRQQPGMILIGWFFPVMIMLMFGGLFGGAIDVPGGGYFEFLVPGILTLTMFFGVEGTAVAVSTDAAKGVTDRFRSMPMSGSAVVVGRCIADLLNSIVGLAVMVGAGLVLGWRWHEGPGAALAAIGLLLMLRCALLWVGIYIGLLVKGPEAVMPVQILVWPFGFLSSVFVDPSTMPGWLGAIAEWNPLSATASACRELFGNPGWGGSSWIADNSLLMAVLWPLLLIVVFFPLAVRRYRGLGK